MSNQSFNIEEFFRKAFERHEEYPSEKAVLKLRRKLWKKDFFSFKLTQLNIYYVVLFFGIITSVYFMVNNPAQSNLTEAESVKQEKHAETDKHVETDKQKTSVVESTSKDKTTEPAEVKTEEKEIPLPEAKFSVSNISGCAPLTVHYKNKSENTDSYVWKLGDGTELTVDDPEHVYAKPGTYRASLEVTSENGKMDEAVKKITVYERPKATFEVDESNSSNQKRTVQFVNQSKKANEFLWLFGDGELSKDSDPVHTYDEYQSYKVTLIATSPNGCKDTSRILTNFLKEQYGLSFPYNFVPNPQGPGNDGYYRRYDWPDAIFHPEHKGVKDYSLTITTQNGLEIFSTHRIEQGWNGYIRGRLAPAGTYLWEAKGSFANGEEFSYNGRVTVKHEGIRDNYGY